jgi:hypothetical protein
MAVIMIAAVDGNLEAQSAVQTTHNKQATEGMLMNNAKTIMRRS